MTIYLSLSGRQLFNRNRLDCPFNVGITTVIACEHDSSCSGRKLEFNVFIIARFYYFKTIYAKDEYCIFMTNGKNVAESDILNAF